MPRSETEDVTTDDLGNGIVQHHRVNMTRSKEPQAFAREQIRQALSGRASVSRIDDAEIVVCELVTNALKHTASGPVSMNLDVYQDTAVMWIHDGDSAIETVRVRVPPDSDDDLAEGGRGLYLVDVLAAKWFVWPTARGKAVVAVIELADDPARPER